jgi:hypothetical protein
MHWNYVVGILWRHELLRTFSKEVFLVSTKTWILFSFIYWLILVLQIPIGTSNTNWYVKYQLVPWVPIGTFKYQLVLQLPIGTLNTNWYFEYQLVLWIPIGTLNTNWYVKYQLVRQIPIGTSNTNWYFEYQLVLQIPIGTSNTMSNDPPRITTRRTTTKSRASTTSSRLKIVLGTKSLNFTKTRSRS